MLRKRNNFSELFGVKWNRKGQRGSLNYKRHGLKLSSKLIDYMSNNELTGTVYSDIL